MIINLFTKIMLKNNAICDILILDEKMIRKGNMGMNITKVKVADIAADLGEISTIFAFRPKGEQMRRNLEQRVMSKLTDDCAVELDFIGIRMCDASFIDEFVLKAIENIIEMKKENMIYVCNVNQDIMESFHMAIVYRRHQGQHLPVMQKEAENHYLPVGPLEKSLKIGLDALLVHNKLNAKNFYEILKGSAPEVSVANANLILKRLYDYRLILRTKKKDERGKYYDYYLPLSSQNIQASRKLSCVNYN
ncbi:MAG: hypothetical protein H6Q66_1404 [Firmicutes bacterium]|nr:hypothetical protein [Bacillota bacterium]